MDVTPSITANATILDVSITSNTLMGYLSDGTPRQSQLEPLTTRIMIGNKNNRFVIGGIEPAPGFGPLGIDLTKMSGQSRAVHGGSRLYGLRSGTGADIRVDQGAAHGFRELLRRDGGQGEAGAVMAQELPVQVAQTVDDGEPGGEARPEGGGHFRIGLSGGQPYVAAPQGFGEGLRPQQAQTGLHAEGPRLFPDLAAAGAVAVEAHFPRRQVGLR